MEDKIQRLSEGMDFIEEAIGNSMEPLSFSEASDIVISEGKEKASPYKILGKACGCFAPIGEFSRNHRLYSDDLWPTVLQNEAFSQRLARREVFGCLGHADKMVDDKDIQEGKVSHIVTCLDVREDVNGKPYLYGELEILDTPAGRILEAMYKGGANLYVSSRAAGKLIPVPGQSYSMVRPDQYHVHCFDVVARPGFLQARPTFEAVSVEPIQPTIQEKQIKESKEEEQAQPIITEATTTSQSLKVPLATNCTISSTAASWQPVVATNEEVEELKGQIDKLAKIIEKVVDDVYEVEEEPVEESQETKGALIGALTVLANSNISEGLFEQIVEIIKKSKENK